MHDTLGPSRDPPERGSERSDSVIVESLVSVSSITKRVVMELDYILSQPTVLLNSINYSL